MLGTRRLFARYESRQRQPKRAQRRAAAVQRGHLQGARLHHRNHRSLRLLQQLCCPRALLQVQEAAHAHQFAAGQHKFERSAGVAHRDQLHFCGVRPGPVDLDTGDVRVGRLQQQLVR